MENSSFDLHSGKKVLHDFFLIDHIYLLKELTGSFTYSRVQKST